MSHITNNLSLNKATSKYVPVAPLRANKGKKTKEVNGRGVEPPMGHYGKPGPATTLRKAQPKNNVHSVRAKPSAGTGSGFFKIVGRLADKYVGNSIREALESRIPHDVLDDKAMGKLGVVGMSGKEFIVELVMTVYDRLNSTSKKRLLVKLAQLQLEGAPEERWHQTLLGQLPGLVKFLQLIFGRSDIVEDPKVRKQFDFVFSQVSGAEFSEIKPLLEAANIDFIDQVETEPMAAGSVAQVHRGGEIPGEGPVVVKVIKPGVREALPDNLSAIGDFLRTKAPRATLAAKLLEELKDAAPEEVNEHLEDVAITAGRDANEKYLVPTAVSRFTTVDVLVMREITPEVAKPSKGHGVFADILRQIELGCVHGDPNPGNILRLRSGRKNLFLDWGLNARLTLKQSEGMIELLKLLGDPLKASPAKMRKALGSLTSSMGHADMNALLRSLQTQSSIIDSLNLVLDSGLLLTSAATRTIKALIQAEGVERRANEKFDVRAYLRTAFP